MELIVKLKTSFFEYAGRDILDIEELKSTPTIASAWWGDNGAGKPACLKF